MLPLNIVLLVLPLTALAAPVASPIKPIFGSWGGDVNPFKQGKIGDKWNPSPDSPPDYPGAQYAHAPAPKGFRGKQHGKPASKWNAAPPAPYPPMPLPYGYPPPPNPYAQGPPPNPYAYPPPPNPYAHASLPNPYDQAPPSYGFQGPSAPPNGQDSPFYPPSSPPPHPDTITCEEEPCEMSTSSIEDPPKRKTPDQIDVDHGTTGQKQAKESSAKNEVTRMAASNSVALFNGVPVDPMTGHPIKRPQDPAGLHKRSADPGLLKKKLGLGFLNDPNVNDDIIREHMKSPEIGMGLAAPKGTYEKQSIAEGKQQQPFVLPPQQELPQPDADGSMPAPPSQEEVEVAPVDDIPLVPAAVDPKEIQRQQRPWSGNSYMIYNGVATPVGNDVTAAALGAANIDNANDDTARTLHKRGGVRNKLGLGMFDSMPSVSGRRKTPASSAEEDEEEEEDDDDDAEEEEAEEEVAIAKEKVCKGEERAATAQKTPAPPPEPAPPKPLKEEEIEELEALETGHQAQRAFDEALGLAYDDLPAGKSFVIYNGKAVEYNNAPIGRPKVKKPRPAFRGDRTGDDDWGMKMVKRDAAPAAEPGRKYTGLNPFKPNPITGEHIERKPQATATETASGDLHSQREQTKVNHLTPHTSEDESVSIKVGDSYAMFNGQPISLGSVKGSPRPGQPQQQQRAPNPMGTFFCDGTGA